jgi:hypothetical protein
MGFQTKCNSTLDYEYIHELPYNGKGWLTFHNIGLLICVLFGGIAVIISLWSMIQHSCHYSRPQEQRQSVLQPLHNANVLTMAASSASSS